jgi:phosphatidylglycerol:prolipoprotein diacylglycerol transferase
MSFFQNITFHWYGFIIGLAAVSGIWLSSKKAKKYNIPAEQFESALWWGIVSGFIGSRLWHVFTDFSYYSNSLIKILFIWNGGLSIIGGIAGAVIGLFIFSKRKTTSSKLFLLSFLDVAVFGLPVAQMVGRIGNYLNNELYGIPTNLPWGIFIAPEFRTSQYLNSAQFHPLFAYEMICTGIFALALWWCDYKKYNLKIGSGLITMSYILYYSVVRFLLDFLRIEKSYQFWGLGFNQVILLLTSVVFLVVLLSKFKKLYGR